VLNIDQARAGGEGMLSSAKKRKEEEAAEGPDLFQTKEQKVKVKVPDGWHTKEP
jgi:hypothetical protein